SHTRRPARRRRRHRRRPQLPRARCGAHRRHVSPRPHPPRHRHANPGRARRRSASRRYRTTHLCTWTYDIALQDRHAAASGRSERRLVQGRAPGRRRHRLPLLLLSSRRAAASADLLDYVGGGRSEGDHPRASPGIGPVRRGDQRTRAAVLPIRRRQDREVPRRKRHQVFLEPEGLDTHELYVNGLSTSLPVSVQLEFLHAVPGLERATMTGPGYAIEYDYYPPTQLTPWLETKPIEHLFFAGQINGTTGYEEAAGQGVVAGINAVRRIRGAEPVVLGRDDAYIGVLVDDLVTRGVDEQYRLFTSS